MIGLSQEDEIERVVSELTCEQEEELEEMLDENEKAFYWSGTRRLRWMYQQAISRGWLSGPS